MKKFFTLRSIFSLLLLIVATGALCAGLRISILEVREAAFFPVAAFAITLSYCLGFGTWPARRAGLLVFILGFILAFLESARLMEPLQAINRSVPAIELQIIRSAWQREPVDLSELQSQVSIVIERTNIFTSLLLTGDNKHSLLIEFFWDLPLLLFAIWMGWCISRHNQVLLALAPSLIFHAVMLNHTGQNTTSIQIAVFAMILLLGINQRWNQSEKRTENTQRVTRETYSTVILISIAFAIIAGITPTISTKKNVKKTVNYGEAGGLLGDLPAGYTVSGLPRQHLIGLERELSQATIFTVKTGELEPTDKPIIIGEVPRHYWRWLTYDVYTGKGWESSPVENSSYTSDETILTTSNVRYQIVHQQIEKTYRQDKRLFWTGMLTKSAQPFSASWRVAPESLSSSIDSLLNTDMFGALTEQQSYQVDSLIPIVSANQLRTSLEFYPQEIHTKYLRVPQPVTQRVIDLAYSITKDITNPYDKAKAIEIYLREYPYSLDVPPPPQNQDVADYFLFDLRTGYCDYYATSMIVMARTVGLPARLVVGYSTGTYDPIQAEYVVHEADAHSWVEVYFAGTGWVEFEPTASQLPITLPDSLLQEDISSVVPFPSVNVGVGWNISQPFFIGEKQILFIASLTSILLISSLWILNTQGLLKPHKTVSSIYKYIFHHGRKIYRDAPLYETPSIFADKLRKQLITGYPFLVPAPDEIKVLTDLYLKEAYTSHSITKGEHKIATKVWRKLFWRLLYARMVRL